MTSFVAPTAPLTIQNILTELENFNNSNKTLFSEDTISKMIKLKIMYSASEMLLDANYIRRTKMTQSSYYAFIHCYLHLLLKKCLITMFS